MMVFSCRPWHGRGASASDAVPLSGEESVGRVVGSPILKVNTGQIEAKKCSAESCLADGNFKARASASACTLTMNFVILTPGLYSSM